MIILILELTHLFLKNQTSIIELSLFHILWRFCCPSVWSAKYCTMPIILENSCDFVPLSSNTSSLCSLWRRRPLPQGEFSALCDNVRNGNSKCQFLFGVQAGSTSSFHSVTFFLWVTIKHPLKALVRLLLFDLFHVSKPWATLVQILCIYILQKLLSLYWQQIKTCNYYLTVFLIL